MSNKIIFLLVLTFSDSIFAQDVINEKEYQENINLTNRGWELNQQNKYVEAVSIFSKAIEAYNGNTDSYTGRATAYQKQSQYSSAEKDIKEALKLSKNEADIYYQAGNILIKLKKYNEAINNYSKALEFNDQSSVQIDIYNCHYNRGNAYLFFEKYEAAVNDFTIALKRKVTFANAYHNRGIAYRHLNKKEEACTDFKTAVHFGSEKTSFYVTSYCKDTKTKKVDYDAIVESKESPLHNDVALNEKLYIVPEFLTDTLYYNQGWKLCNRESYTYYRVGTFKPKELKFIGPYEDYYKNNALLEKGSYDSIGLKFGYFERFHDSGILYSKGNFEKNDPAGTWDFYHENGNILERVKFTGKDFVILDSNDENNIAGVVDGTGNWTRDFPLSKGKNMLLKAYFKDGYKTGMWKLKMEDGELVLSEKYKNGKLEKGTIFDKGISTSYRHTKFTPLVFISPYYPIIEAFQFSSSADQSNYPYFKHLPKAENEADAEKFDIVEDQPNPLGGMSGFYKHIGKTMRYPSEARKKGIEGRVFVQFVVDKDGSLTEVKVLRGIGSGCDEEAVRAVKLSPKWTPGMQKGKPVKVRMILPITFKLS